MTRDVLTMEGRFDWGRYDFGTFRRRDVFTMGRFDCKARQLRYKVIQDTMRQLVTSLVLIGSHRLL